jgi:hypothetical protein
MTASKSARQAVREALPSGVVEDYWNEGVKEALEELAERVDAQQREIQEWHAACADTLSKRQRNT